MTSGACDAGSYPAKTAVFAEALTPAPSASVTDPATVTVYDCPGVWPLVVTSTTLPFTNAAEAVKPLSKVNCVAGFVMLDAAIARLKLTRTVVEVVAPALTTAGAGQLSTVMSAADHGESCDCARNRQSGVPISVTLQPCIRS